MNLIKHYQKLWFYNFHRMEGLNYIYMRSYFAEILIHEMEEFVSLKNKQVLDVGGARGEFCKIFNDKRQCKAVNLDPSPTKYGSKESDFLWPATSIGAAYEIPFGDNVFDLVICRGVLEHIPTEKQQISVNEMYRVTKKGGFCYFSIPPWFNPFAGHGLKPFHYLPFKAAKCCAELIYGKKISANSWRERNLFPITFSRMLMMISRAGFKIRAKKNTHMRLHFLTEIPILRETIIPTVSFILNK